jgi:simple sugar transport system ATP-binding protein
LALLGENGSGKTTLMNMLSGLYYPDEGTILVEGKEVKITSPKKAFDLGIGMVHQHFKLIDTFSAGENIILGLDDGFWLKMKDVNAKIATLCERYSFQIDLNKKVYDMSVSEKQKVEIVKLLYRGTKTLILDEPTAVLTPQETDNLFNVLRLMKKDGKAIIIITHKLNEVLSLSDRVAILRNGELVKTVLTQDTNEGELTDAMVGEHVKLDIGRALPQNPTKVLEINHLTTFDSYGTKSLKDVSFVANGGEILGIAGVSGSGQKALLEAIAGLQKAEKGSSITYFHNRLATPPTPKELRAVRSLVFLAKAERHFPFLAKQMSRRKRQGKKTNFQRYVARLQKRIASLSKKKKSLVPTQCELVGKSVKEIKNLGISLAFVPEDRLGMGLVGDMDMVNNMMLRSYENGATPFLRYQEPSALAEDIKKKLAVNTPSVKTPVRKLSGGNVQKVLVGREIASSPRVLMTAYAVRGLDINTSYTIYNILNEQKKAGLCVIYVGEDLDVLLELADRILVLSDGQVTGILDARKTSKSEVGALMSKQK